MTHSHKDRWNARYAAVDAVWSAAPNGHVARAVVGLVPGRALDLACGEGRHALWLAGLGWQVTALDFADVAIARGRTRAASLDVTVDWLCADLADFVAPPASFDLVVASFVHTSSAQRRRWLGAALAVLAPGGTFVWIGHDPRNPAEGHGGPRDGDVLPGSAELLGRMAGFTIVHAETVRRAARAETGHGGAAGAVALDLWVVARRP